MRKKRPHLDGCSGGVIQRTVLTVGALILGLSSSEASAAPFTLDRGASTVAFRANQPIFGGTDGTFHRFKADFDLDREDVTQSKLSVAIEAASVDTGNGDRDSHLRKPDFFHVEKYPNVTFESTKVEGDAKQVIVTGRLTIKETTTVVRLPLALEWTEADGRLMVRAQGSIKVNRFEVGLTHRTPWYIPEIEKMVELKVDVRAYRAL